MFRLAASLLCAVALPLSAAEGPDATTLAAIGWLGWGQAPVAGSASCSAVLVGPDLVVTAAHCLIDPATGDPVDAGAMTFAAGLSGSRAVARRQGLAVIALPEPQGWPPGLGLALLRLVRPIPAASAHPLPLTGDLPDNLVTVGYPRTAPDRAAIQTGCRVTLREPQGFGLGCDAVSGFSGGAVLAATGAGWALAGVMVAEATRSETVGAIALRPPAFSGSPADANPLREGQ